MSDTATTEKTTPTTYEVVNGTICHVEFTTPDLAAAKSFYSELFGWDIQAFQETEWYFQAPGTGPCGCMLQGEAETTGKTTITVTVDSIADTLARVADLGGETVLGKTEIPGGHGFFAKFRAADGNIFGIYNRSGE